MSRRLIAVFVSVVLLSVGWLGGTGLTLLAAFVPLLWISDSYPQPSRRNWWRVFGWALLTFVLWNAATIWWIWGATPVGPFAATLASSFLNMTAFMLYRTAAAKSTRALAYTTLAAAWITTEYWYTVGEFSWPWLILGNGFSHDVWAVQWYEYTGVFGGSLWVLASNIAIYEAWRTRSRRKALTATAIVSVPMAVSLLIYATWDEPIIEELRRPKVTIVQPDVPVYDDIDPRWRIDNLLALAAEAPEDVDFIIMPETAIDDVMAIDETAAYPDTRAIAHPVLDTFASFLRERYPRATLIAGAKSIRRYEPSQRSNTARAGNGFYYDIYNSAVGIDLEGAQGIYHKGRLVIGVEKMPIPKLFEWLNFLIIDLGGTVGQLGVSNERMTFRNLRGCEAGAAICYEGLYGDFYGGFVREGAQTMLIISNDGWWGDTPGYRHLFTISRLRAIEHRRAIARSANTGRSGFINARGDIGQTLGWNERGTLTDTLAPDNRLTVYTRYGDWVARAAQYILLLCVLCYPAYRVRRRNHLVD